MLVPLSETEAVLLVIPQLKTLTPGAEISSAAPKFEKDALASLAPIAPTVTAEGAEAGESFWALA